MPAFNARGRLGRIISGSLVLFGGAVMVIGFLGGRETVPGTFTFLKIFGCVVASTGFGGLAASFIGSWYLTRKYGRLGKK